MSKVLVIHPYDRTTNSLEVIPDYLRKKTKIEVEYIRVLPEVYSHEKSLETIRACSEEDLVVFLGHGRSDFLYGSSADNHNALVSPDALSEFETTYLDVEKFISFENLDVFEGKKVLCIACNAAKPNGIGQKSIEAGTRVFLGFGEIPTSQDEFSDRLKISHVPKHVVSRFKGEIGKILKAALFNVLVANGSFHDLEKQIRLAANRHALEIVLNHKGLRRRRLIADTLYLFRSQMKVYGQGDLKLIGV